MELSTFGAICKFAIDLEKEAAARYGRLAREAQGNRQEGLAALARAHSKRQKLAEQARRELVTEMILEPIHGLTDDAWQLEESATPDELEGTIQGFYAAAAEKVSIPQATRFFRRQAQESERLAEAARALPQA